MGSLGPLEGQASRPDQEDAPVNSYLAVALCELKSIFIKPQNSLQPALLNAPAAAPTRTAVKGPFPSSSSYAMMPTLQQSTLQVYPFRLEEPSIGAASQVSPFGDCWGHSRISGAM